MKSILNLRKVTIIITLAISVVLMSCDMFEDTEDYKINIVFICSGAGSGTEPGMFDVTLLTDGKLNSPLPFSGLTTQAFFPAGKITSATITATRRNSLDSLMIMVYKDNKLDEKGFALLPSCTSGTSTTTTYCSNTLSMAWKLSDDSSESVSGGSTTSSSSSSSSSSTSE